MRTTKQLLEVMLENIDMLKSGLCRLSHNLYYYTDKMSYNEMGNVQYYMSLFLPETKADGYCWPIGEKEPRIKWLKEQIEKLSKDTINN